MNSRRVALIVPCDKNFNVILQKRKGFIDKPTDYDFGFFGGGLEEGESVEQALKREVKEELSLDVIKIKSLRYFKTYQHQFLEENKKIELNVFLCNIDDVSKMDVKEGKPITLNIKDAINSNMGDIDKKVLKEIHDSLNQNL